MRRYRVTLVGVDAPAPPARGRGLVRRVRRAGGLVRRWWVRYRALAWQLQLSLVLWVVIISLLVWRFT
jgi:hypothetical protein